MPSTACMGPQLIVFRKALFEADEQSVILRFDARFQIDDGIRAADYGIEHSADGAADDEMGAEIVQIIDPEREVPCELRLKADVGLLDHRILHAIIDDVDAAGAGARQDEAGERVADRRRDRREAAGVRIKEEDVAGAALDRQRSAVEAALERLDLERDPVVVDPVAAVNAQVTAGRRPVETDARAKVVL